MVDSQRLTSAIEHMRSSIPASMQEAAEILKQKESIINQAHLESRRVKESAEHEHQSIVDAAREEQRVRVDEAEIVKVAEAKVQETNQQALQDAQQIVQDAQRRAYRIVGEADAAAAARREGADQYARESLFNIEERLSEQLGQVRRGIDALGLEVDTNGSTPKIVVS